MHSKKRKSKQTYVGTTGLKCQFLVFVHLVSSDTAVGYLLGAVVFENDELDLPIYAYFTKFDTVYPTRDILETCLLQLICDFQRDILITYYLRFCLVVVFLPNSSFAQQVPARDLAGPRGARGAHVERRDALPRYGSGSGTDQQKKIMRYSCADPLRCQFQEKFRTKESVV